LHSCRGGNRGPGHTAWSARGTNLGVRACRCLDPCGPAAGAHGYSVLGVPCPHTSCKGLPPPCSLWPCAIRSWGCLATFLFLSSLWVPSAVGCRSSPDRSDLPQGSARGVRFGRLVIRLLGKSDLQPEVVSWVWDVSCSLFFLVVFWSTCGGYLLKYPRGGASVFSIGG
jgi:hypothetical protein